LGSIYGYVKTAWQADFQGIEIIDNSGEKPEIVSQRFLIRNRATKAIFPKGKESYRGFFVLDEIQLEEDPPYPFFPK
jgi:hypothetical protein